MARASASVGAPPAGRARVRNDAGVSLIELVIAFAVLLIVLVPIGMLLTNVLGQSATANDKLTALSLAEKCLEKLNNTGPTLSQGVAETSVTITENSHCFGASAVTESTMSYDVHAEFTWETNQGDHPDLCASSDTATLIEAQVWTTWGHTQKVTDTTLLDYPPPGLPDDGFLAVEVNGTPKFTITPRSSPPADASGRSWSTRVQSVPVTITRTGFSVTLYPNSYGCVFEEVPAPDSYKVTVKNPTIGGQPASPAWASASETSEDSWTGTANLDAVTHVTFRYDEGSLVKLAYPSTTAAEGPVTCPGAGQVQCVVFGQEPSSSTTPAKSPEAELSILDKTTKKWSVQLASSAAHLAALACAGTNQCIAVGYGGTTPAGVSLSSGTSSAPSFTADTVPTGVTALSGLTCPVATRCYAWGLSSSGAVILTGTVTSTSVTWGAKDTLPTTTTYAPARVTSIACWSKTKCYALGTKKTATTPVILSLSTTTTWVKNTLPTTTTYAPVTLSQLVCPAATKCYAVGTRKTTHADVVSLSSATAWKADTWKTTSTHSTKTTVTALSQIDCPSGTVCYAVGTRSAGGAIASLTATTWKEDTPKTAKSVTAITCPSTTSCLAMGTSSTGTPALFWRTAATTFTSETLHSSVTGLWAIACASSSHCFAIGTSSTTAVMLSGTTAWSVDTLPTTPIAVSFFGLACGGTVCAAPGADETAAVYFDGTSTGTTWTNATPTGTKGMYIGGVPIAVTDSGLTTTPVEVTVPSGTASATETPALFPFAAGYSVAATECSPLTYSAQASSTPGATSTATMPMGLLTVRAVNKYGNPDTGATISAKLVTKTTTASSSCTQLSAPTGKTNPTSFNLEPTGPAGLSQVDLPYGTYKIKVTHSTHTSSTITIVVAPTSVTKGSTGAQSPSSPLLVTVT